MTSFEMSTKRSVTEFLSDASIVTTALNSPCTVVDRD